MFHPLLPLSIIFHVPPLRHFAGWFARIPLQCRGATGEATPEARNVRAMVPAMGPFEVTGFLECVRN